MNVLAEIPERWWEAGSGYIPPLQGLVLDFRKLLITESVGLLQARLEVLLHLADILLLLVNAIGGVGRGTVVNGLHGGEV